MKKIGMSLFSVLLMLSACIFMSSCQSLFSKTSSITIQLPSARNDGTTTDTTDTTDSTDTTDKTDESILEYISYFEAFVVYSDNETSFSQTAKPGNEIVFSDLPLGKAVVGVAGYLEDDYLILQGTKECELVGGTNAIDITLSYVKETTDEKEYEEYIEYNEILYSQQAFTTSTDETSGYTFSISCEGFDVSSVSGDSRIYYDWVSSDTKDGIVFTEITDEILTSLQTAETSPDGTTSEYEFDASGYHDFALTAGQRLYIACHIFTSDGSVSIYSNTATLEYYYKNVTTTYSYKGDTSTTNTYAPADLQAFFDSLAYLVNIDENGTYTDADGEVQTITESCPLEDYGTKYGIKYTVADIGYGEVPLNFNVTSSSSSDVTTTLQTGLTLTIYMDASEVLGQFVDTTNVYDTYQISVCYALRYYTDSDYKGSVSLSSSLSSLPSTNLFYYSSKVLEPPTAKLSDYSDIYFYIAGEQTAYNLTNFINYTVYYSTDTDTTNIQECGTATYSSESGFTITYSTELSSTGNIFVEMSYPTDSDISGYLINSTTNTAYTIESASTLLGGGYWLTVTSE